MSQDKSSLEETLQSISHIIAPEDTKAKITLGSKCLEGDTPLHVFIWRAESDNVRLLLSHGADIHAVGEMGQTPLHVAIMQENMEIAELLLQSGASTSVTSELGTTPLEEAKAIGGDIYQLVLKYAQQRYR